MSKAMPIPPLSSHRSGDETLKATAIEVRFSVEVTFCVGTGRKFCKVFGSKNLWVAFDRDGFQLGTYVLSDPDDALAADLSDEKLAWLLSFK